MLRSPYTVQLPVYEGPLDLLLELIERAELDITKVSLAQVTDQYLEHIRAMQDTPIENLASFLVIAARLIQIKSEALLPRPVQREPGEEDPGDALARQLVAYKKYKQVAIALAEREAAGLRSYVRLAPPPRQIPTTLDLEGIGLEDLRRALMEALAAQPEHPALQGTVVPPRVTIRQKIKEIVAGLRRSGRLSFRSLIRRAHTRLEIVLSFIALLELIKQRQIEVSQESLFDDIEVSPGPSWTEDQEPAFDLEFEE